MNKLTKTTAVVISGCWPGSKKGYEIACNATLDFISSSYEKVLYFGPKDENLESDFSDKYSNVEFIKMDFDRAPQSRRFLRSLFSIYPAICVRFFKSINDIITHLESINIDCFDVIYEDIPTTYFIKPLKALFPKSRHIVRSHNVVYKGFQGMKNTGSIVHRIAWAIELAKILKQERRCFQLSDFFISISSDDTHEYKKIGILPDASLGVYLPYESQSLHVESKTDLIHIGTADLRKGSALRDFINNFWPDIHTRFPHARFYIAGKNTDAFDDPDSGVYALGMIDDEKELFSKGRVFINPQLEGSGVKIKSIVALSYSCCLVSTTVGVEGINLVNGHDAIVCDGLEQIRDGLISIFEQPDAIDSISLNGRNFYMNNYTHKAFISEAKRIWDLIDN